MSISKINKLVVCALPFLLAACNSDNASTPTAPSSANNNPPANNSPPSPGTFIAPNVADVRAQVLVELDDERGEDFAHP